MGRIYLDTHVLDSDLLLAQRNNGPSVQVPVKDIVFSYGGKSVQCSSDEFKRINTGNISVIFHNGKYIHLLGSDECSRDGSETVTVVRLSKVAMKKAQIATC